MEQPPLKTFICYAHEDREAVENVCKQLATLKKNQVLEIWDDGQILPGEHWDESIKARLEAADIVLLFVSVDFINSDYIETNELKAALKRHHEGLATIVPVIVRSCDWPDYFDIGKFQALPAKARPIYSSHFPYKDEAYHEVAQGIKALANKLMEKKASQAAAVEREHEEKQNRAAREASDLARRERTRKNDLAAWKAALDAAENTTDLAGQNAAFEVYLDNSEHTLHREDAEKRLEAIKTEDTKRLIAERKNAQAETERKKKEQEAREQAERERKEKERLEKEEAERKKREAEASRPKNGQVKRDILDGPEMVFVEGSTFQMGSNEKDIEKPIHPVAVTSFWMGKYPVTFDEYDTYCAHTGKEKPKDKGWGRGTRPVIHVSWHDAQEYCKWLFETTGKQYRLPSESEWEYAARGGNVSKGYKFSGGNELDKVAWNKGNSNGKTQPVGQLAANEIGLHDMSGNVWEWCQDAWHKDYKGAPADGSAWEKGGDDTVRVLRGGSWHYYDLNLHRSAGRSLNVPTNRNLIYGFRLAQD